MKLGYDQRWTQKYEGENSLATAKKAMSRDQRQKTWMLHFPRGARKQWGLSPLETKGTTTSIEKGTATFLEKGITASLEKGNNNLRHKKSAQINYQGSPTTATNNASDHEIIKV